jgi:hypothetical protein
MKITAHHHQMGIRLMFLASSCLLMGKTFMPNVFLLHLMQNMAYLTYYSKFFKQCFVFLLNLTICGSFFQ